MSGMEHCRVIIVGGGPAGSSCAWRLRRHGVECLVLDQAVFPREKLCAGWITPECVRDLELDPESYPHSFLTFERIRVHLGPLGFAVAATQHSIRRVEFDAWLLERSGAPVVQHQVKSIRAGGGGYVIDDRFSCDYVVGAGGTRCPVHRNLFREANPRARELQALALEQELPHEWSDSDCHLWFFHKRLPGYSWYVPKAGGHLNLGVGAMAARLKQRGESIHDHWNNFTGQLARGGLVEREDYAPAGYSYYLRDGVETLRLDNAFLAGDAAGLATRDLCEGIGPAVRSGLLAADAIALGRPYSLESVSPWSLENRLARNWLDRRFTGG